VTFGSVGRRGRARFGSTKPKSGSQVAKIRQKFRIAATIHRVEQLAGRAAGDAYSYGERAYDPPHVRHLLLVCMKDEQHSGAPLAAVADEPCALLA
jgi:hypothetical protein